jgi:hypothetical protein
MITGFMEKLHQGHDIKKILTNWWVEDIRFFGKTDRIYMMINLKNYNSYAMPLMCRLYGEQNNIHFKHAWVPIVHIVITRLYFYA